MRQYIFSLLLLALTACSTPSSKKESTITTENNNSKSILIDIDKEFNTTVNLRGKNTLLIDTPIYIGDNDEVSFKGEYLEKVSPVKVKIGDNDEVSFRGNHYIIQTMKLYNGDIIQMQGKDGNTFIEIEVVK
ncbi:MAG: hypothetical protein DSZ07_04650 [Sulfurovum sp.]|nr:MAG: hypothetical protein DSZ07_04650 [Sulfurovum sp.]